MLEMVKIEDIQNETQRMLAEIIGIDSYIKLVDFFGGMSIYILKKDSLLRDIRDRNIRKEFNGSNYAELAKKYNLTDRTIRDIVDNKNLDGQIKFDLN